jgi:hypothetical protein
MPWFPNPSGGAPIQADQNPNPAGGTYGQYSDPGYNGPPPPTGGGSGGGGGGASGGTPPTGAPPTQTSSSAAQLAAGINSLLGAIASGNKQAFDEAVRQFNVSSGLDQSKFDESIRQFNQNYAISQAGLTGTYNGQQTQQAQLQAYNEAIGRAGLTGYYQDPTAAGAGGGLTQSAYQTARTQQLIGMGFDPAQAAQTAQSEWAQGYAQSGNVAGGMPPGLTPPAGAAPGGLGTPTLQAQAQWANLFGTNAAPTAGQSTLAAQQQAYAQQMGVINAAAALQANPFRQAQVMGQAGRVLAGMPTAGFSAPNTVPGVGTQGGNTQGGMGYLQQMMGDINAGGYQAPGAQNQMGANAQYLQQQPDGSYAGGTPNVQFTGRQGGQYGQSQVPQGQGMLANTAQMIQDIRDPTANTASPQDFLNATPTPNKIDSAGFLRSAPGTQNLILQAMQEKYGIDPNDALSQIKNTLPQFNAPNTVGTVRRG